MPNSLSSISSVKQLQVSNGKRYGVAVLFVYGVTCIDDATIHLSIVIHRLMIIPISVANSSTVYPLEVAIILRIYSQ